MKVKQVLLILCLAGLATKIHALDKVAADLPYDPDARINLKPRTQQVHTGDNRDFGDILMTIDLASIGMPGDGYDNGGLTWDGQYLYLLNMYDNNVYVIDPGLPQIVSSFAAPPTLAWGLGSEQNLWITEYYSLTAYEYTHTGTPTGNSFYCLQGGASWMGDCSEWWPDGEIWILAVGGTNAAYKFALPSGALLGSISDPTWTYISQRGLTYDPFSNMFWVGGWNSDMIWELMYDGTPTGRSIPFMSVASLAYDWQGLMFPGPILWVATNDYINQIYMLEVDYYMFLRLWNFENGWQSWSHTNGQSYPAGWDVQPYNMHPDAQSPYPGSLSMWIDSDSAGPGIHVVDTAWSPALLPYSGTNWLKWGCGYQNNSGIDTLSIGIREMVNNVWQEPVRLRYYAQSLGPGFRDSVDVSAYNTAEAIQICFVYDDHGSQAYYASFDNVWIIADWASLYHDAGCSQITSPPSGVVPPGDYDVIGHITNWGDFWETFDATAKVYENGVEIYTTTVTLMDIPPYTDTLLNFGSVTFQENSAYLTEIYTQLLGDMYPGNDTCTAYSTTIVYAFWWNFEDSTTQGWTHTNGSPFPWGWGVQPSDLHPAITPPGAGSYCMWIDSHAAGYGWIHDSALSPAIAPNATTDWLGWCFGNYSMGDELHVGIKFYTGGIPTLVELACYPSGSQSGPAWDSADVSDYNYADSLQVYFYYDDLNWWGWYAAFDNVMINGDTITGITEQTKGTSVVEFGFDKNLSSIVKNGTPISYTTTKPCKVCLRVYDLSGRLVRSLIERNEPAGAKTVLWDARDGNSRRVSCGVYFLVLEAEDKTDICKLGVIR